MANNDNSSGNETKKPRPSYTSIGQAEAALDIFRRVNPKQIDTDFVVNNNLATRPNAFKIIYFYRWLGIIDSEGVVNANSASKLRMIGSERDDFVKSAIKESYKDLFEEVNITQATKDDLINFFIRKYEYTQLLATFVASLFISLCQKYNIPLSENIKVKTSSVTDKEIAGRRKQAVRDKKSAASLLADTGNKLATQTSQKMQLPPVEKDRVRIIFENFKGSQVLDAASKRELDSLLQVDIPALVNFLKLSLPDEEKPK